MEFFTHNTHIDFMQQRNRAAIFSLILFVISVGAIWINGLNLGLDFTGGIQFELHYPTAVSIPDIRHKLESTELHQATVQTYGSTQDVLIRIGNKNALHADSIKNKITSALKTASIERIEYIGPQVGNALLTNGMLALLVSMIITMLYIAMRFEYRFALSAIIALFHDPIVILGIFALFKLEFNLISLTALLTILGYSLNDTIVVYDRIRENFRKDRHAQPDVVVNTSINQTLSRTIMTSGLTLLVVIALFMFGGESLQGFALALIIGIVIGTYSSIYIAGALAVAMGLQGEALTSKIKDRVRDHQP